MLHLLSTRIEDIRKWQEGDKEAFRPVYERYREAIVGYVIRRGMQRADAENVSDEVFERLLKGNEILRYDPGKGRFRGWLTSVIRQTAFRYLRDTTLDRTDENRKILSLDRAIGEDCPDYREIIEAPKVPSPEDERLKRFLTYAMLADGLLRLKAAAPNLFLLIEQVRVEKRSREEVCLALNIQRREFFHLQAQALKRLAACVRDAMRDHDLLEGSAAGDLAALRAVVRTFCRIS